MGQSLWPSEICDHVGEGLDAGFEVNIGQMDDGMLGAGFPGRGQPVTLRP